MRLFPDFRTQAGKGGAVSVTLRTASADDAGAIHQLYKLVRLSPSKPENLRDFDKRGGMIQIPPLPQIKTECAPGSGCFAVAESQKGKLEALARFSRDISGYEAFIEDTCLLPEKFVYFVELVIRPDYKHLSYPFLLTVFDELIRIGLESAVFEIYLLESLGEAGRTTHLMLDNIPSKRLNEKLGAVPIGTIRKTVASEHGGFAVCSTVYMLELAKAVSILLEYCEQSGWEMV